jgi:hypothetical protein
MADPDAPGSPDDDDIQFDHAEYEGPVAAATTCAACKQAIDETYYEANGVLLCPRCAEIIQAHLAGGSGLLRFARAGLFGFAGAVAGFGLYFGVLKLTGREIALISIVVGLVVGSAVRAGSRGRGGWAYQGLAVFLTYSAIVASYTAMIVPQVVAGLEKKQAAAQKKKGDAAAGPAKAAAAGPAKPADAGLVERPDRMPTTLGQAIVELLKLSAILLALLYAFPIVAGFHQPIGLLIIGFALWEAWKLNRRTRVDFHGPFLVGDGLPEGAPGHA